MTTPETEQDERMARTNRRKRPPIGRTEPDRSFSGWVRPGAAHRKDGDDGGARSQQDRGSSARESSYQAINGAYRLIDEYMRQGQKMAEELWLPTQASERDDNQFGAPMRFMRAVGDMTMAWVEVMQQWTTNAQPPSPSVAGPFTAGKAAAHRAPEAPGPTPAAEPMQSLRVSVKAAGLVEVSVHVADSTDLAELVAGELRPFSGEARPIRTVNVEPGTPNEGPVLRIVVPKGQPAGTYNGLLVVRGTHQPRGTISLVVS